MRALLNTVLLQSPVERTPRDAAELGRLDAVPVALAQGLDDPIAFAAVVLGQGAALGRGPLLPGRARSSALLGNARSAGARQVEVGRLELVLFAHHPGVQQHVLQLAHVAGPAMAGEQAQGFTRDALPLALVARG